MATDAQPKAVNGSYGANQPYGQAEPFQPPHNSNTVTTASYDFEASAAAATASSETPGTTEATKPPSKDEVGWYFVESYYTTLSKNPETLYVRRFPLSIDCNSHTIECD